MDIPKRRGRFKRFFPFSKDHSSKPCLCGNSPFVFETDSAERQLPHRIQKLKTIYEILKGSLDVAVNSTLPSTTPNATIPTTKTMATTTVKAPSKTPSRSPVTKVTPPQTQSSTTPVTFTTTACNNDCGFFKRPTCRSSKSEEERIQEKLQKYGFTMPQPSQTQNEIHQPFLNNDPSFSSSHSFVPNDTINFLNVPLKNHDIESKSIEASMDWKNNPKGTSEATINENDLESSKQDSNSPTSNLFYPKPKLGFQNNTLENSGLKTKPIETFADLRSKLEVGINVQNHIPYSPWPWRGQLFPVTSSKPLYTGEQRSSQNILWPSMRENLHICGALPAFIHRNGSSLSMTRHGLRLQLLSKNHCQQLTQKFEETSVSIPGLSGSTDNVLMPSTDKLGLSVVNGGDDQRLTWQNMILSNQRPAMDYSRNRESQQQQKLSNNQNRGLLRSLTALSLRAASEDDWNKNLAPIWANRNLINKSSEPSFLMQNKVVEAALKMKKISQAKTENRFVQHGNDIENQNSTPRQFLSFIEKTDCQMGNQMSYYNLKTTSSMLSPCITSTKSSTGLSALLNCSSGFDQNLTDVVKSYVTMKSDKFDAGNGGRSLMLDSITKNSSVSIATASSSCLTTSQSSAPTKSGKQNIHDPQRPLILNSIMKDIHRIYHSKSNNNSNSFNRSTPSSRYLIAKAQKSYNHLSDENNESRGKQYISSISDDGECLIMQPTLNPREYPWFSRIPLQNPIKQSLGLESKFRESIHSPSFLIQSNAQAEPNNITLSPARPVFHDILNQDFGDKPINQNFINLSNFAHHNNELLVENTAIPFAKTHYKIIPFHSSNQEYLGTVSTSLNFDTPATYLPAWNRIPSSSIPPPVSEFPYANFHGTTKDVPMESLWRDHKFRYEKITCSDTIPTGLPNDLSDLGTTSLQGDLFLDLCRSELISRNNISGANNRFRDEKSLDRTPIEKPTYLILYQTNFTNQGDNTSESMHGFKNTTSHFSSIRDNHGLVRFQNIDNVQNISLIRIPDNPGNQNLEYSRGYPTRRKMVVKRLFTRKKKEKRKEIVNIKDTRSTQLFSPFLTTFKTNYVAKSSPKLSVVELAKKLFFSTDKRPIKSETSHFRMEQSTYRTVYGGSLPVPRDAIIYNPDLINSKIIRVPSNHNPTRIRNELLSQKIDFNKEFEKKKLLKAVHAPRRDSIAFETITNNLTKIESNVGIQFANFAAETQNSTKRPQIPVIREMDINILGTNFSKEAQTENFSEYTLPNELKLQPLLKGTEKNVSPLHPTHPLKLHQLFNNESHVKRIKRWNLEDDYNGEHADNDTFDLLYDDSYDTISNSFARGLPENRVVFINDLPLEKEISWTETSNPKSICYKHSLPNSSLQADFEERSNLEKKLRTGQDNLLADYSSVDANVKESSENENGMYDRNLNYDTENLQITDLKSQPSIRTGSDVTSNHLEKNLVSRNIDIGDLMVEKSIKNSDHMLLEDIQYPHFYDITRNFDEYTDENTSKNIPNLSNQDSSSAGFNQISHGLYPYKSAPFTNLGSRAAGKDSYRHLTSSRIFDNEEKSPDSLNRYFLVNRNNKFVDRLTPRRIDFDNFHENYATTTYLNQTKVDLDKAYNTKNPSDSNNSWPSASKPEKPSKLLSKKKIKNIEPNSSTAFCGSMVRDFQNFATLGGSKNPTNIQDFDWLISFHQNSLINYKTPSSKSNQKPVRKYPFHYRTFGTTLSPNFNGMIRDREMAAPLISMRKQNYPTLETSPKITKFSCAELSKEVTDATELHQQAKIKPYIPNEAVSSTADIPLQRHFFNFRQRHFLPTSTVGLKLGFNFTPNGFTKSMVHTPIDSYGLRDSQKIASLPVHALNRYIIPTIPLKSQTFIKQTYKTDFLDPLEPVSLIPLSSKLDVLKSSEVGTPGLDNLIEQHKDMFKKSSLHEKTNDKLFIATKQRKWDEMEQSTAFNYFASDRAPIKDTFDVQFGVKNPMNHLKFQVGNYSSDLPKGVEISEMPVVNKKKGVYKKSFQARDYDLLASSWPKNPDFNRIPKGKVNEVKIHFGPHNHVKPLLSPKAANVIGRRAEAQKMRFQSPNYEYSLILPNNGDILTNPKGTFDGVPTKSLQYQNYKLLSSKNVNDVRGPQRNVYKLHFQPSNYDYLLPSPIQGFIVDGPQEKVKDTYKIRFQPQNYDYSTPLLKYVDVVRGPQGVPVFPNRMMMPIKKTTASSYRPDYILRDEITGCQCHSTTYQPTALFSLLPSQERWSVPVKLRSNGKRFQLELSPQIDKETKLPFPVKTIELGPFGIGDKRLRPKVSTHVGRSLTTPSPMMIGPFGVGDERVQYKISTPVKNTTDISLPIKVKSQELGQIGSGDTPVQNEVTTFLERKITVPATKCTIPENTGSTDVSDLNENVDASVHRNKSIESGINECRRQWPEFRADRSYFQISRNQPSKMDLNSRPVFCRCQHFWHRSMDKTQNRESQNWIFNPVIGGSNAVQPEFLPTNDSMKFFDQVKSIDSSFKEGSFEGFMNDTNHRVEESIQDPFINNSLLEFNNSSMHGLPNSVEKS